MKRMTKTIYVPQGYSARFMQATQAYGINGLYTDGFTTCNIVVCISHEKMVLAHVDGLTIPEKVQEEIEWVGQPSKVIIISRSHDEYTGDYVKNKLLEHLKKEIPSIAILEHEIDGNYNGVYVSFKLNEQNNIHPNIKKYPIHQKPEELIHHPDEQQIQAVTKIEQIIGMDVKLKLGRIKNKQFYIFDGRAWEPLSDNELKIDSSHPLTKNEMKNFSNQDPYLGIASKLAGILEYHKQNFPVLGETKNFVIPISIHLEGYLNNYDHTLLFKRNLKQLINDKFYKPQSKEDNDFKIQLNALLNNQVDVFDEVKNLVNQYQEKAPATDFKNDIIEEYENFSRHYQERRYYHNLKQTYKQLKELALSHYKHGVKYYEVKNYVAAANLFLEGIKLSTLCCLKTDPNLASLYFNAGRSKYFCQEYQEAETFINTSLILRQHCTEPRPTLQVIERTRNALQECQDKIAEQANCQQSRGLNFVA